MSHGQPDYGQYAAQKAVYGLSDLGEVAARLGSIVTYDRRGIVDYLDDFEGTVGKFATSFIGAGTAALDSDTARSGSKCVKIVTGALLNNYSEIIIYNTPLRVGKWGVCIAGVIGSSGSEFEIQSEFYSGSRYYAAVVKFNASDLKWYYLDSAAAYQEIASVAGLQYQLNTWHHVKLVADFENNLYSRFMFNNTEYDLSDKALYGFANATLPYHRTQISVKALAAAAVTIYVDDFIFTVDEP